MIQTEQGDSSLPAQNSAKMHVYRPPPAGTYKYRRHIKQYCAHISFYLKEQDELWKSLNRFHHQAVQSHPVIICLLTMLCGRRRSREAFITMLNTRICQDPKSKK